MNIFMQTIDHMSVWHMKVVIRSQKPSDNHHMTLQLPSALGSVLASAHCSVLLQPTTLLFEVRLTTLINLLITRGRCA